MTVLLLHLLTEIPSRRGVKGVLLVRLNRVELLLLQVRKGHAPSVSWGHCCCKGRGAVVILGQEEHHGSGSLCSPGFVDCGVPAPSWPATATWREALVCLGEVMADVGCRQPRETENVDTSGFLYAVFWTSRSCLIFKNFYKGNKFYVFHINRFKTQGYFPLWPPSRPGALPSSFFLFFF